MRPLAGLLFGTLILGSHVALAAEGMPQLDFANPLTIAQVVWGAVIFFVLYRLLAGWALPQVAEVLERRAATISSDLNAARDAKTAADGAVAELTESMRAAQSDAQLAISNATSVAKAEAASRAEASNAKLDAQLAEAEARINTARASALGALRDVAVETTMAVVARLTGRSPDSGHVDAAVDAALAARGHA